MIRQMKRVYIFYTQDKQRELVARLQKLGVMHLEESKLQQEHGGVPTEGPMAKDRREVENSLIKARGIVDLFKEVDPALIEHAADGVTQAMSLKELTAEFRRELESLEGRLKKLVSERRDLRDRQSEGALLKEVIATGDSLLRELPRNESAIVAMIGAPKDARNVLDEIKNTLNAPLSGRFAMAFKELPDKRLVLLVSVDPEFAELVADYIREKGFAPVTLPQHVSTDFIRGISQLKAEETTIPTRLQELERELAGMAKQHAGRVLMLANALENWMAQIEVTTRFGYTDYTLLITGWVPADELEKLQKTLTGEFSGLIVQEDPIHSDHNEIPIALRERKWSRPYKLFLDAFGVPKHGSVDPVPYISIFFPIFFGIIVGDIGYGLIVLLAAVWGLKGFPGLKKPGLKKMAASDGGRGGLTVMRDGALFAIMFGFLFGEIFGLEFSVHLGVPQYGLWPFSRIHFAIDLLNFMLVIGFIMITLGFLFGIVTALRHHNRKELMIKIGLYWALLSFAVVVGSLMKLNDPNFLRLGFAVTLGDTTLFIGLAVFVVTVIFLGRFGGMIAAVEALSPFIHVLSYARLMGFALAGAVLAGLINELATGMVPSESGVSQLIGILLAAVIGFSLHAFNLVLHVFEGSIQSARLHWVEFFGKFILENLGGKPYQPFKEKSLLDS